jgi:hypothetical protein
MIIFYYIFIEYLRALKFSNEYLLAKFINFISDVLNFRLQIAQYI